MRSLSDYEETPSREWLMKRVAFYADECDELRKQCDELLAIVRAVASWGLFVGPELDVWRTTILRARESVDRVSGRETTLHEAQVAADPHQPAPPSNP